MGTYAPLAAEVPPVALFVWGGRSDARVHVHGEVWRYLSSMLLHSSIGHLASNMVGFLAAGACLERRYGWWVVLPLYLVAGLGANLYSATWEGCDVVVGASGAVLGLCAAVLADLIYARRSMRLVLHRVVFVVGVAASVLVDAVKAGRAASSSDSSTSSWSHVGGALCGFAAAALLLPLLVPAAARVHVSLRRGAAASPATPRRHARMLLRSCAAVTTSAACAGLLIFTFVVLPLNLMGTLRGHSFAAQPKACAATCRGWCECSFGGDDAGAGAPCHMADRAFASAGDGDGGGDLLRTLRGSLAAAWPSLRC